MDLSIQATTQSRAIPTQVLSRRIFLVAAVLSISLLALGLRLLDLGEWSFWGDELITVGRASDLFAQSFTKWSASRLITAASLSLLGTSEWSARIGSALIGALTVPLLFFPLRQILGRQAALISVLLLAISPWHLYWSQNARFYTALLLFFTLGLLAFFLGIEQNRPRILLLSLFLFGLGVHERLLGLFFVPITITYIVCLRVLNYRRPRGLTIRNLTLFFGPGAVIGAGLMAAYPNVRDPSLWLASFGWVNNNPVWILGGVVFYVGILVVVLALAAAYRGWIEKNRAVLLFTIAALIPLATIMAISTFHYAANRYAFVSLTSWAVLASVAIFWLIESAAAPRIVAVGVLVAAVLTGLADDFLYFSYQNGNRDNWKAAFELIADERQPGDLVVVPDPKIGQYYSAGQVTPMAQFNPTDVQSSRSRVWLLEDINVEAKHPGIHRWMLSNAQLMGNFDVHVSARNFKMRVYLYEP